jgi:hypothetical protein
LKLKKTAAGGLFFVCHVKMEKSGDNPRILYHFLLYRSFSLLYDFS